MIAGDVELMAEPFLLGADRPHASSSSVHTFVFKHKADLFRPMRLVLDADGPGLKAIEVLDVKVGCSSQMRIHLNPVRCLPGEWFAEGTEGRIAGAYDTAPRNIDIEVTVRNKDKRSSVTVRAKWVGREVTWL